MIGKCNLPRQKIAALGRLLIMRPSETTYVYLAKNYQSSWGLKVTSQIVLLLLHALSGVPFPSVIRICVRPPDNQEDKMWGYIWKYSQFIKNSLWQEDRCNKILMREVEIGLIAMLFKFTWMHQPHRSQNMSNPPLFHLLVEIVTFFLRLYHLLPLLALERCCIHCSSQWEVNNEVDSVALRAEAMGRINVRAELIDYCALPTSVYEDDGLLIKSKTKKRW